MKFCPKCGAILLPKPDAKSKKMALSCVCGYVDKSGEEIQIKESVSKQKDLEVIDNPDNMSLPIVDAECIKCKNKKAFFWSKQTRAADEPETKFFRCVKCKNTWRDYS